MMVQSILALFALAGLAMIAGGGIEMHWLFQEPIEEHQDLVSMLFVMGARGATGAVIWGGAMLTAVSLGLFELIEQTRRNRKARSAE